MKISEIPTQELKKVLDTIMNNLAKQTIKDEKDIKLATAIMNEIDKRLNK